jgi:23S rRNA-/tRNA-specific pseudouridylate synthase
MTHIGHPIVGDRAYGSTIDPPRIMLHAQSLTFSLFEKEHTFEAEVPGLFMEIKKD